MEEQKTKRKTTTSSAVKNRYNKKVYTAINLQVPKQMAADFKAKCEEKGVSKSQVLKAAIEEFLKD